MEDQCKDLLPATDSNPDKVITLSAPFHARCERPVTVFFGFRSRHLLYWCEYKKRSSRFKYGPNIFGNTCARA